MIRLRRSTPNDLIFVMQTEQHPENCKFVGQWTRDQHESAIEDANTQHLIIEPIETAQSIGFTILEGFTDPNKCCLIKRIVITEKGKGYGKATLKRIQQIVFEEQNFHRLWLDVKTFNARARALYKSVGFVEEGLMRECLRNGDRYDSLIIMSMLASEYCKMHGS